MFDQYSHEDRLNTKNWSHYNFYNAVFQPNNQSVMSFIHPIWKSGKRDTLSPKLMEEFLRIFQFQFQGFLVSYGDF